LKKTLKTLVVLAVAAWRLAELRAPFLLWRYFRLSLFIGKSTNRTIKHTNLKLKPHNNHPDENSGQAGDLVIPVYNNYVDVNNLLLQIDQDEFSAEKIIIVNDASTDGKIASLLSKFCESAENRFLITNEENLGFIGSINCGMRSSTNDVVILNTDIVIPKTALSRMFSRLWEDPAIATVTPFTNAGYLVGFPHATRINPLPWKATVDEIDLCFQKFNSLASIDVPSGVGFCMAISRKALDDISDFDEAYNPGYGEETDFCLRATKVGYRNVIAPDVFVFHRNSGSFDNSKTQNLKRRNALRILRSHPQYQKFLDEFFSAGEATLLTFLALNLLSEQLSGNRIEIGGSFTKHNIGENAKPRIEFENELTPLMTSLVFREENFQNIFENRQGLLKTIEMLEQFRSVTEVAN